MKLMKTEDAVGQILCHDITEIVKDKRKGPVFRKGHIITEEDIPVLLRVGKDHVYIWENDDTIYHENEGAEILLKLSQNEYMKASEPKEGKINLTAEKDGILKVHKNALNFVNAFGELMIASRHGNFPVKKGDTIAGMRIIPLIIKKDKMDRAYSETLEILGEKKIFEIKPFSKKKVGLITTGNEVFYGRIEDTFSPVVMQKLDEYGSKVVFHETFADDDKKVTSEILNMISKGADFVLITGGMSVDPDDRTPLAIKNTGARIVTYGSPVLPGAMIMLSYYKRDDGKEIPIMGLPGCVMYSKRTVFDLLLPRIVADDEIFSEEISSLGEGGLCLNCETCTFPNCGFGK